jgi:hypothetical protein
MMILAIGIEHTNLVPVDGPKRSDTREKHPSALSAAWVNICAAVRISGMVPLRRRDGPDEVFDGLPQGDQLLSIGQGNWLVEFAGPGHQS